MSRKRWLWGVPFPVITLGLWVCDDLASVAPPVVGHPLNPIRPVRGLCGPQKKPINTRARLAS